MNFSVTQILREIDFAKFRMFGNILFDSFRHCDFNSDDFDPERVQKMQKSNF